MELADPMQGLTQPDPWMYRLSFKEVLYVLQCRSAQKHLNETYLS